MKRKITIALGLLFVFSLLFSLQFSHSVQAENTDMPLLGPITNPITGPVTGPITGPGSVFTISGNVLYHLLGFLSHGVSRFIPASGVNVTAVDIFNQHTSSTVTDANGNYTLNPGQAGFYKVTVSGGQTSFYVPPFRFINDNKPAGINNVDFQGLIFKL